MEDYTNDYRGPNNRYKVRKHNNRKKEKELHRSKFLSSRSPARSSMKNTLVTSYTYFDDNTIIELDNDWEPVFLSNGGCLAYQLYDLIKTNDIEGIETLLLYSDPSLLKESINIPIRSEWHECHFCKYRDRCCEDEYTKTALHYAIDYHSKNLSTIKTLLKYGSDPTTKDAQGDTALHLAIQCRNKEIVQEILHYEFKHNQRDEADLTRLMLAMEMELEDILDIFYQILPRQEYIDEMMLLGCHYALGYRYQYQFEFAELDPQASIFFEKALKLQQQSNSNTLPCDVYKLQRECQTIDELRAIQFNPESMYIQALLVYERLLPQRNEISLLIQKLFTFYKYYLNIKDYNQCLLILIHLYPMILSCKENMYQNMFHSWDKDCLKRFADLLNSLMINQDMKYIDYIIHGFKWTLNGLYNDNEKLCHICLCATYLIESNQINIDTKCQLIRWIKEAIRHNRASKYYKDHLVNQNLFNIDTKCQLIRWIEEAIRHNRAWKYYKDHLVNQNLFNQATIICLDNTHRLFQRISHKKFLHLLIYCGADANEASRYRPLHQAALHPCYWHAQSVISVIETLITVGTHTDCLDYQGLLPEQRASNLEIRDFLYATRSRSLKCLCVQLIISKKIQYQSFLSDRLKSFILMHQSK